MSKQNDNGNVSRRRLLTGAAGLTAAGLTGATMAPEAAAAPRWPNPARQSGREPFFGRHQGGIVTRSQTHALFVAFDVTGTDRRVPIELLRQWTLAAEAMSQGRPAPDRPGRFPDARQDNGLVTGLPPARLTVTFGFGASLFDGRFGWAVHRPAPLVDLPAFPGDALVAEHCDGDLLIQIAADDPQVLSAVFLQMRSLAVGRATLRWSQQGFISPPPDGTAPRNLLGLHDGTSNPTSGLDQVVWADRRSPAWMQSGTYLTFRKIRLLLPNWSLTTATEQDRAVGRRLPDGSPLSARPGSAPHTPLDLKATDSAGRPLIDHSAHVRRMHPHRMLRRSYNYDYGFDTTRAAHEDDGHTEHGGHDAYDAGLLFVAFTTDPRQQFIPAQQELSGGGDLLARFMSPTASAMFAIPPGLRPGRHFGQLLG